jgi:lipopolysaccharide/colanic/teichoic acid biosynthesis glycosyltransferase
MHSLFPQKRLFDFALAFLLILILWPLLLTCFIVATIDTRSFGLFAQKRIGRYGRPFAIYKIKTMLDASCPRSEVTTASDRRITKIGFYMRRFKLDELPQLVNILLGQMSFVGPRPDVPGFADCLKGADRRLLLLRPGLTGPAQLVYKYEEELLDSVSDPVSYNRDILWPRKVSINLQYLDSWCLDGDLRLIFATFFALFK